MWMEIECKRTNEFCQPNQRFRNVFLSLELLFGIGIRFPHFGWNLRIEKPCLRNCINLRGMFCSSGYGTNEAKQDGFVYLLAYNISCCLLVSFNSGISRKLISFDSCFLLYSLHMEEIKGHLCPFIGTFPIFPWSNEPQLAFSLKLVYSYYTLIISKQWSPQIFIKHRIVRKCTTIVSKIGATNEYTKYGKFRCKVSISQNDNATKHRDRFETLFFNNYKLSFFA